ncbi:MAG: DNA polymerase III subunit epsilon [Elusimicrobia bacterium GWA2_64_40]|nr:MAG: DNA polymerase III subunit epsilon [Elusimicrobia bacterium GWA2_64_40]OGR66539.1 MAG: DNA polymerase III subunit epsilon [Elusimicrobia bacterium GWB2_63_16]HAN05839.1 3'-5' exonuclease [Elusimicrobiota bacterium]
MYLFFDTETTGLPRSWNAPVTALDNWPRLVQLAYMAYDGEGGLIAAVDTIVKPQGFTIPVESSRIHGITTERALAEGRDLGSVLRDFKALLDPARYLVAHNISFDEKIIGAEFLRNGLPDIPAAKHKICTMHSTTEYCAIPGPRGYKWPKLTELHRKLFNADFSEAHNAAADIAATAKCFWELKEQGIIKIPV